jgi:multidrug efflux pump subunit AcrA (membrane-fusion protein)
MRLLRRRTFIAIIAVLCALIAGTVLWMRSGASTVQYRTAAATMGTVTQTVALTGNLTPVASSNLNFSASGRVISVDVQVGQPVTAGEQLATLDPSSAQSSLAVAQANLSAAEARLSLDQAGPTAQALAAAQAQVGSAQAALQNAQTSYSDTVAVNQLAVQTAQNQLAADQAKDGCNQSPPASTCTAQDQAAISQDTTALQSATVHARQADDAALGQVTTAKVQLQNAQASLRALYAATTPQQIAMDQSQVQIDQLNVASAQAVVSGTTLVAPQNGVVAAVNVSVGDFVSSGASSASSGSGGSSGAAASNSSSGSSSSAAIVVITPGSFEVTGSLSDALVNRVALGQKAQVTVAGATEAQTGEVSAIAQQATVTSGVATFPVTVTLDGSDPSLRAGMSASVSVVVNQVVGVLTVPTSAVRTSAGGSTVQVLVNGQPQTRTVQVGAADALRTQIISGLNSGDQVVIATVSASVPSTQAGGGLFGGGGFGGGGGGGRTRTGGAGATGG